MRSFIIFTFTVLVIIVAANAEERRKKTEGCLLNGVVYSSGQIAYEDKSHCMRLKCIERTNKKGRTKYLLKAKPSKNCRCSAPCPKCSTTWDPVCGTNNKTYTNGCQLWGIAVPCGRDQASLLHEGECGKCPTGCPDEVKPVCGTDNKTYDNECLLLEAACNQPSSEIKVARRVSCEDVPKDTSKRANQCKYNRRKYDLGETIEYLGSFCMEVSCQPASGDGSKRPQVVFQEFLGSRSSCQCASHDSGNDDKWKYEVKKSQ